MKNNNLSWLKDSFLPFLVLFIVALVALIWSDQRVDQSSKSYVVVSINKASAESEIAIEDDSKSADEESDVNIFQSQFIDKGEATALTGQSPREMRSRLSDLKNSYLTNKNSLEAINNYFAAMLRVAPEIEVRGIREEILVETEGGNKIVADNKKKSVFFNNLALSYDEGSERALMQSYFLRANEIHQNWFSNLGLSIYDLKKNPSAASKNYFSEAIRLAPIELRPQIYYSYASRLGEAGHLEISYDVLTKAIELRPDYVMAYIKQAAILRRLKRYDEAEKMYHQLLLNYPESARVHFNFGILLSKLDKFQDAIKEFKAVLLLDDSHQKARRRLAGILFDTKQYDKAAVQFKILQKRAKRDPTYLYWLGKCDIALKKYQEAETHLKSAIEMQGGDYSDAWLRLADVYLLTKRENEAIRALEDVIRLRPDSAAAHYDLGLIYFDKKDFLVAQKHIQKAVELRPDNSIFRRRLAAVYVESNQDELALAELIRALKADPDNINTLTRLGELLGRMKRYASANRYLEQVLQINPKKSVVWFNYGQNLLRLNRYQEAISAFGKSIAVADRQNNQYIAKVLRFRAQGHVRLKDLNSAKADLSEAMDLREDYAEAREDMTRVLIQSGENEKAKDVFRQGLALDPKDCGMLRLGRVLNIEDAKQKWSELCNKEEKKNATVKKK